MTPKEIKEQTLQAYKQHSALWTKHASEHAKFKMKSFDELNLVGVGRACVLVANGYSFEEQLPILKKHHKNVDIMACDKTLGHLLDNGIKPTYVVVCDARVNYQKYMEPWKDQLKDSILFMNVCANSEWSHNGNWKDKFFFANMDIMGYEKEFARLSGCNNFVTAGTNVSNMMVVLLTQCRNESRQNKLGYDKLVLCGFDYSWRPDGKYYAFDQEGGGKFYYMRHIYGLSGNGRMLFTSNNLASSASWLNDYVKVFKIPIVQCSKETISDFGCRGDIEESLRYRHKTSDLDIIRTEILKRNHLAQQMKRIDDKLKNISLDHHYAHLATV